MKDRKAQRPRRDPAPLKIGDVLGEQIKKVQDERARRKELEAMGFKPLKGDR